MVMRTNDRRVDGFTLIEMLITVAIIAILAAIAYPSHTESTQDDPERANARAALTNAVQWMERQFTTNTYPTLWARALTRASTVSLFSARTATSFTLQASPVSPWSDPKCATLMVTNLSAKSATGSEGGTYCWSK